MTSEERSCLSKKRYTRVSQALAALGRTCAALHLDRSKMQAYNCRFCHGWHIGHLKRTPEPLRRIERK